MRSERFPTPGPLVVRASLGAADLEVTSWDEPVAEVTIESRRDDEATQATLEAFAVELRPAGTGGHELLVREPKGRGLGFRLRDPQLRVRVRCPHGTAIDVTGGSSNVRGDGALGVVGVKSGSGDVVLAGVVAAARITSASGDVRVHAADGDAAVTTASGDVTLGRVGGRLSVNAVSGDVQVEDARAGAAVQSVSGDVRLASVGGGDIRVQTVSGDAEIAIAPGTAVWIDAGSVSGDVGSELDVGDAPPVGEQGPVAQLRVKTVSGDVSIVRARAVAGQA